MRRLECGAGRRRAWRFAPLLRRPMRETAAAGAAPARVLTRSTRSGCVGAPPGGTTASCREPADGGRTGPESHGGRVPDKGTTGARPEGKPDHPRKARPDAAVKTPRWSAGRRAGPVWPVISGRTFRRWARPRGGPPGAASSAPASSGAPSPLAFFLRARPKQARPARHHKRAAERWLARLEDRKDNRCRGRERSRTPRFPRMVSTGRRTGQFIEAVGRAKER